MALDPLTAAMELGDTIISRFFPDKGEQAQRKAELLTMMAAGEFDQFKQRVSVIVAEAQSKSWLTASWRPITMLTFVAIIANNYMLYPYLSLFWQDAPVLEIPPDMWGLLKIGLGGYVVGRSGEKIAEVFKK